MRRGRAFSAVEIDRIGARVASMKNVTWSIQTPPAPGAVAIVQLTADSADAIDQAAARVAPPAVPVGRVGLRSILGIDRGLAARWTARSLYLMPHGGSAIARAIAAALTELGIPPAHQPDPREAYPEAADLIEARMLAALAGAASPLAVDLLLDQPRRWRALGCSSDELPPAAADLADASILGRLIQPPLVVAIGPPNVGKSTLVNALAGRAVSIVADEPGTTRDHVGVSLDLAGLVVRYADTPGRREPADAIEREAQRLAADLAQRADLLLLCGDAAHPPAATAAEALGDVAPMPSALAQTLTGLAAWPPVLMCATRSDLGLPNGRYDAAVSVRAPESIAGLVRAIRDRLVPPAVLADPRPWRFWGGPCGAGLA